MPPGWCRLLEEHCVGGGSGTCLTKGLEGAMQWAEAEDLDGPREGDGTLRATIPVELGMALAYATADRGG
jgi:hypothetical protein